MEQHLILRYHTMKNYNILIIDDEKSQRDILQGYLAKKGYKVFTAESGSQGIKIINENLVDIVLSDYQDAGNDRAGNSGKGFSDKSGNKFCNHYCLRHC